MGHRGVIITAGFDKSRVAISIAELLKRKGIAVKGFMVVTPWSLKRLRSSVRKRGLSFITQSIPRLLGFNRPVSDYKLQIFGDFLDQKNIHSHSIKKWCKKAGADYLSVSSVNSEKSVEFLKKQAPQWLIYSGGGIIQERVIRAMNGAILNAHQGPLPETRGMNAAEWSVLLETRQEATIHLIDKGIDTGDIIKTLAYSIEAGDTIHSIREKAIIKGIEGLVEVAAGQDLNRYNMKKNHSNHRQCYILSSAMKELLSEKLKILQTKQ